MDIRQPIIIISAARSGTKLLRYILDASPSLISYPYDANYVWKYGNYRVTHDEISPGSISEEKKNEIRLFFAKLCKGSENCRLLEKSVPNSLRIPFVRSVFPNCKLIHLYRNGLDVAADARICWQASAVSDVVQSKVDRNRKLKEFPFKIAWPYLLDYAFRYGKKHLLRKEAVSSWGPKYNGIDKDIYSKKLIEVCAIQWSKCVQHCCSELDKLRNNIDYINVKYEDFVRNPEKELKKICEFIQIDNEDLVIRRGVDTATPDYIGFADNSLTQVEKELVKKNIFNSQYVVDRLKD